MGRPVSLSPATTAAAMEEALAASAPLARRLAGELCHVDPGHGRSCAWYHGFWQYLRWFDFVTTPRDHADFYRMGLAPSLARGDRRILISGTADYEMPAQVLAICRDAGLVPEITVLDICRTPLRLCEWHAERAGARIETVAADIRSYRPAEAFDLLCTHSFFGRFSPEERPGLLARWHDLLRPGGRVVAVNRIRGGAPDTVRFTTEQAERFVARVKQAADAVEKQLDVPVETIMAMAAAYIGAKRTHPVRSLDDLVGLFEGAGFRMEQVAVGTIGARARRAPRGPTMSGGAEYARIVAERL